MSEKAKFTGIYDDGESVCVEGPASKFNVTAETIYNWKVDEREQRRAQFACAAMQELLASDITLSAFNFTNGVGFGIDPANEVAQWAVKYADALLAALEKAP